MTESHRPHGRAPLPAAGPGGGRRHSPAVLLVLASLSPLALYYLLRPVVHSDGTSLAIAAAAPVGLALASPLTGRRSLWGGLLVAAGFGLALAATVLSGGSSLPLKLYRPLATGVFGLACLISVAVRRPLVEHLLRAAARRDPRVRAALARADDGARLRRRLTGITLIVGVVCLAEAAVTTALAFSLPTGAFLVTSRVIRWAVAALGVAAALLHRYRTGKGHPQPAGGSTPAGGGAQAAGSTQAGGSAPAGGPAADDGHGRNAEKTAWFGPRRHGFGWGPRTWQARLIVLTAVGALVVLRLVLGSH
ncbi:VC0807 family protein [Streptomyces sp. MK7]|uniref:VC0807 family protein n=1 Tax=Streptomyces sp. MK7 TaxID=3067635 RepID=UPI00292D8CF8|nr:VC0807 family protein [Streptomyces sp. MK7]